jgi:shikimate dehydrogenase
VRSGELAGANVTVPWKRQALALADRADPSASAVGAANVLVRAADGALVAHNTDVPALARELRALAPAAARAVVLGSGGAAVAAVAALRSLGVHVATTARRWSAELAAEEWAHSAAFRALGSETLPWPKALPARAPEPLSLSLAAADVLVQATSAGMHGAEPGASIAAVVDWPTLASGAVAYDLVYNPPETEFLRAAAARGLVTRHGLGMLVGQAALALELWLGVVPPLRPLQAAAEDALSRSRGE